MKKIVFISILILMFMASSICHAASGYISSPWKKSGTNVSLARSTDNVGIGTATPGGLLHLATPTIYLGQAIFEQASGDVDSFDLTFRKARGTIAAPTVITTADELGFINFAGYSGAGGYVTGAAIKAYSSGTIATTRVPANLRFYTGTDAAPTVLSERMRITNAGLVGIGEDTPIAQLMVKSASSTTKTLTLKMAASQSVNPFEIVDSTDVAKVTVASTGIATFANDVYANGNLYTGGLDYGINPGIVNVFSSVVDPNSVITTAHGYNIVTDGSVIATFQAVSNGAGSVTNPRLGIGSNTVPSLYADATLTNTGVLCLKETTTPTADVDYGKLYTTSGNLLYFQDGAGESHEIGISNENYGEMYFDNNSNPNVMETANNWMLLRQTTVGYLGGFTYDAGSIGSIVAYADGTGKVNVTSYGHGLITGDEASIRGTTHYNGVWTITLIDPNSFSIADTWEGDDGASDWQEGAYLQLITGSNVKYSVSYSMSATDATGET